MLTSEGRGDRRGEVNSQKQKIPGMLLSRNGNKFSFEQERDV